MSTANVIGHGRQSALRLAATDTTGTVLFMANQGAHFDGSLKRLSFYGNGTPGAYVVDVSGYTVDYENLFIRSNPSTVLTASNGLRVKKGQDFTLRAVQAEFCEIGIHLDDVRCVSVIGCNTEFCNTGLLISQSGGTNKGRHIVVDRLYCEETSVGMKVKDSSVKLLNGIYAGKTNTAIQLENGDHCFLDMSQGDGKVILDQASSNNTIIVPMKDHVRVTDNGFLNRIRTIDEPRTWEGNTTPDWTLAPATEGYNSRDKVFPLAISEKCTFEFKYRTSKQANIYVQLYDQLNQKLYNFDTKTWDDMGNSIQLPYATKEACVAELPVDCGIAARKKGLFNVFVSNGYDTPESVSMMNEFLDGITVDFKGRSFCFSKYYTY